MKYEYPIKVKANQSLAYWEDGIEYRTGQLGKDTVFGSEKEMQEYCKKHSITRSRIAEDKVV
jgi:hypothetical protein